MAGALGPLLETGETDDLDRAWVDNVRAQWRSTGAYRTRPIPGDPPTGPVLPVSKEEWRASAQTIFLAFNDVAATLGLAAATPESERVFYPDGLEAALRFRPARPYGV